MLIPLEKRTELRSSVEISSLQCSLTILQLKLSCRMSLIKIQYRSAQNTALRPHNENIPPYNKPCLTTNFINSLPLIIQLWIKFKNLRHISSSIGICYKWGVENGDVYRMAISKQTADLVAMLYWTYQPHHPRNPRAHNHKNTIIIYYYYYLSLIEHSIQRIEVQT